MENEKQKIPLGFAIRQLERFYLHTDNEIVIGWHSEPFDEQYLEESQKLIEMQSSNPPDKYIGLNISQIYQNPLPILEIDESYKQTPEFIRRELKELFFELQFAKELNENINSLQKKYNKKLKEYTIIKK